MTLKNPADSTRRNHDPDDLHGEVSQQIHVRRFYAVTPDGERHGSAHRAHGNAVVPNGARLLQDHTADAHAKS